MEATWNHYYGVVEKFSLLTGIWPYLELRTRLLRTIVLTLTLLTVFVPQVKMGVIHEEGCAAWDLHREKIR